MAFPLASALSPSCLRGTCLLQATSLCSPSLVGFLRQGGGRRVCGDGFRPMPSSLIAGKAVFSTLVGSCEVFFMVGSRSSPARGGAIQEARSDGAQPGCRRVRAGG